MDENKATGKDGEEKNSGKGKRDTGSRGKRKQRRVKTAEKLAPTVGRPPGTLEADPHAQPTEVSMIAYRKGELVETKWKGAKEAKKLQDQYPVLWVQVVGFGDLPQFREVGEAFKVHPLALEDVIHTHQRPKLDEFGEDVFWVARLPHLQGDEIETQQVSLYLGEGVVISFHEKPDEVFEVIRDRLRNGKGRLRGLGADYLAYAVMDTTVDHFFPVMESLSDRIEVLEERVVWNPGMNVVRDVHKIKRSIMSLRRAIWPLRGVCNKLITQDVGRFGQETKVYLHDLSDHVFGVLDLLETHRELGSSLLEIYLSSNGNRMNEIMKVLTMIATVFIPLSFIAGLYGMNFKGEKSPLNMPELDWYWGYPFVLALMGAVAAAFVWFFKKKGWLGGERKDES